MANAMKWFRRVIVAVLTLGLVLAGVVAWVVPGIARREAAKDFEQATGRKLTIGELSIHPFTWRVEIRDFAMSEVGGTGTFAGSGAPRGRQYEAGGVTRSDEGMEAVLVAGGLPPLPALTSKRPALVA